MVSSNNTSTAAAAVTTTQHLVYSDWILCTPNAGILLPGQVIELKVTAHIKSKHMDGCHSKHFEEILVIRVKGGGDLFCVVTAIGIETLGSVHASSRTVADYDIDEL
jgi:hypothetical protein